VGCAGVRGGLGGGSRGSGGHEQTTTLSNLFDLLIAYVNPGKPTRFTLYWLYHVMNLRGDTTLRQVLIKMDKIKI